MVPKVFELLKFYCINFQRPTILIPDFVKVIVDTPGAFVDILHINYTDPGDCVQFFCYVTCINDAGILLQIEDGKSALFEKCGSDMVINSK